jgi:hypothetical protein
MLLLSDQGGKDTATAESGGEYRAAQTRAPFPDPDSHRHAQSLLPGGNNMAASPAKFEYWKEQTSVLEDAAAFRAGVLNLTGGAFPEQLKSDQVSANYFRLFGAPVVRGRTFTARGLASRRLSGVSSASGGAGPGDDSNLGQAAEGRNGWTSWADCWRRCRQQRCD